MSAVTANTSWVRSALERVKARAAYLNMSLSAYLWMAARMEMEASDRKEVPRE